MNETRVTKMQTLNAAPGASVAVYITSKLAHAQLLVDLKKNWPYLYFTARWPVTSQHPSEKTKLPKFWTQDNETDLLAAQVVVGFSHPNESTPLRDTLWELALAHAHRKPIYLAGPVERFGSYAFCSSVAGRFETLEAALGRVSELAHYETHADKIGAGLRSIEATLSVIESKLTPPKVDEVKS